MNIEDYYYLINKSDWTASLYGTKMTEEEAKARNEKLTGTRQYMNDKQVRETLNISPDVRCDGVNHHLYTVCLNCGQIG